MEDHLSARQAAARLGISDRTLRRLITDGQIPATRDGDRFRIAAADLESYAAADAAPMAGAAATARQPAADGAALVELVHLVDRLQREVVARTEAATLWQARAEMLASQVERLQLAIEAPKDTASQERLSVEPTQTPATPPRRAPW